MNPKSVHNDYLFYYMNTAVDLLMHFAEANTQKQRDAYRYHVGRTICVALFDNQILYHLKTNIPMAEHDEFRALGFPSLVGGCGCRGL